jgi:hypothetical protein
VRWISMRAFEASIGGTWPSEGRVYVYHMIAFVCIAFSGIDSHLFECLLLFGLCVLLTSLLLNSTHASCWQ